MPFERLLLEIAALGMGNARSQGPRCYVRALGEGQAIRSILIFVFPSFLSSTFLNSPLNILNGRNHKLLHCLIQTVCLPSHSTPLRKTFLIDHYLRFNYFQYLPTSSPRVTGYDQKPTRNHYYQALSPDLVRRNQGSVRLQSEY